MAYIFRFLLYLSLVSFQTTIPSFNKDWGHFTGIVLHVHPQVGLLRNRFEFSNQKYLSVGDQVEFWVEGRKNQTCKGRVISKGIEEALFKIPYLEDCMKKVPMRIGSSLEFHSKDLIKNLESAQRVLEILKKKRKALVSKVNRIKNNLNGYMDIVSATNDRYEIQTIELEKKWREELSKLEQDKINQINDLKELELRLNDTDMKTERFFYQEKNWEKDKWALDQRIYHKK